RKRPHDALTSQVGDYRLLNDMAPLSWNGEPGTKKMYNMTS
ncbi:hypothetical protein F442_19604, partial [Phytophthora nicotianae P10297]